MNINKLLNSIPASFEYEFTDEAGDSQTETINVKIRRLSFRESVSKEFQDAAAKIATDQSEIANLLVSILEDWDLTTDDKGTKFEITVENLLDNTSGDFIAQLAECVMGKLSNTQSKQTANA